MNGGWQKLAMVLLGVIVTIAMGWTTKVSGQLDDHDKKEKHPQAAWARDVRDNQEAIRSLHRELKINRGILNRIDKNTGGPGDAPPPEPLVE